MSNMKNKYKNEVVKKLQEKFNFSNPHLVPKLEKIVVNSVNRDVVQNAKLAEAIAEELSLITGQKAVVARARNSVASFKVREGQALGAYVTLRGAKMYEFLDRLVNITLPRVRDFRGVSPKGFDGRGNYNLGLKEQIIFPEINYDKVDKVRGMNITFITSARNNEEGRELLREMGMPFGEK